MFNNEYTFKKAFKALLLDRDFPVATDVAIVKHYTLCGRSHQHTALNAEPTQATKLIGCVYGSLLLEYNLYIKYVIVMYTT
jgi:hypothetical protein